MKTGKRLLSFFLALMLLTALGATAFAANTSITVTGSAGSTFAAYRLLDAADGGSGKFSYTVNADYSAILQTVTQKTADAEIVAYIGGLDADELRDFADAVYGSVKNETPDATTTSGVFSNVAQGYYLVAEIGLGSAQDTYSLVMLDTAGNDAITVQTKESTPTLTKKVQEKNDSTGTASGWQDAADYDIGDTVAFRLTGTVSEKIANYDSYYYAFHDIMAAGLTLDADSVAVSIDGNVLNTSAYAVVTDGLTDGCGFEVRISNLKNIAGVAADSVITVGFTATLNANAVIGDGGNANKACLEYGNDPYGSGTAKTPWDKVVVFTYELNVDKVDGNNSICGIAKKLPGAGFTLYKYIANGDEGSYVEVGGEVKGTEEKPMTTFVFSGLDAGMYKLVETTVPAGYNKADDLVFVISATYDILSDNPKLTALAVLDEAGNALSGVINATFWANRCSGIITTKVVNCAGVELPSTGGVGTTVFTVVGLVLMLGAAIMLVTRKRMKAER